jgi:hypothetical protein
MTSGTFCAQEKSFLSLGEANQKLGELAKTQSTDKKIYLKAIGLIEELLNKAPTKFWIPRNVKYIEYRILETSAIIFGSRFKEELNDKHQNLLKLTLKHRYLSQASAFPPIIKFVAFYENAKKMKNRKFKLVNLTLLVQLAPDSFWSKKLGGLLKKSRAHIVKNYICNLAKELAANGTEDEKRYYRALIDTALDSERKKTYKYFEKYKKDFEKAKKIVSKKK